jgi:hypothetical protein
MMAKIVSCGKPRALLALSGIAASALLMVASAAAENKVRITPTTYKGWDGAYRMSNGTVEVVVVPAVGRILRYGFVGGDNVLWENPTASGKPGRIADEWNNIGGDKIWPWPQDEWEARTGRAWPPPPASDQVPYQARVLAPDTLRITSPVLAGYGVRIVRDLKLAASGTRLTLTSRLQKVREGAEFPVAPWSVTQIPVPALTLARLVPGSTLESGYRMMSDKPFRSVRREGYFLVIERNPQDSTKLGADADLLAGVLGDLLFTQKLLPARGSGGSAAAYRPGDRAQVYAQPDIADDQAKGIQPYIELELTAPLRALRPGEDVTLSVAWELRRLRPDQPRTAEAVSRLLQGL